jgi:hypothetical protein
MPTEENPREKFHRLKPIRSGGVDWNNAASRRNLSRVRFETSPFLFWTDYTIHGSRLRISGNVRKYYKITDKLGATLSASRVGRTA